MLGPETPLPPPKCPACGAGKPIPIVYGMPDLEMREEEERGVIELGGCCICIGENPAWRCRQCGEAFGTYEDDLGAAPSSDSRRDSKRKRG